MSDGLIADLTRHCDLEERVGLVPPSAKVRGLYFNNILQVLTAAGRHDEFLRIFPQKFSSIGWYPMAEYLTRLAVGGAILESPLEVHHGMSEIGRRNAIAFSESLLGKTMLRLLSKDPQKLLKQGAAARRQSWSSGRWDVHFPGPREAIVAMYDEYVWIDSNLRGAAVGTFESIGLVVEIEVELVSRFEGRHILSW